MEHKIKALQEAKNIIENLKTNLKSMLLSDDKISNKLLEKLKKSPYVAAVKTY